ncbi:MAG: DMT family transporter [Anaerolineales bacterium]
MGFLNGRNKGIAAALMSAFFLGLAPVFGKQAISSGFVPLAVVALRTSIAAVLLLIIIAAFKRPFLYIFPVGLIGCVLAGAVNGIGSILYYMALGRLDASMGQLLYSLYPLFVALWLILDQQAPTRLTMLRIGLAAVGVFLLVFAEEANVDPLGVAMMIGASALYALHLPINQRVLYEIPAPTVTLYTLLAMSAVVVPAYLIFDFQWPTNPDVNWGAIAGLTLVTFASRLTLFLGVKHLGGMQTALLGLAELLVTILFSIVLLGEMLTPFQIVGAVVLGISLLLVALDKAPPTARKKGGWLGWIRPPAPPTIPWDALRE